MITQAAAPDWRAWLIFVAIASALPGTASAQGSAQITGTVLAESTALPIAGAQVVAYKAPLKDDYEEVKFAVVKSDGTYVLNLWAGEWYLSTRNSSGFVNEVYGNFECLQKCDLPTDFGSAQKVTLTAGAVATANFELARGGSITGRATRTATGDAVVNRQVIIMWFATQEGVLGRTDGAGNYLFDYLPAGNYEVLIQGGGGDIGEVYDNIVCALMCSGAPGESTPVPVTKGAVTSGINFSLDVGGTIAGAVTTVTGAPLSNSWVILAPLTGRLAPGYQAYDYPLMNPDGRFSISGFPAGAYVAFATRSGYIGELYSDIPCVGTDCSIERARAQGTVFDVRAGETTTNINFALDQGGGFSGRISAGTRGFAGMVSVFRRTSAGIELVRVVQAAQDGLYAAQGMPAGSYYAFSSVDPVRYRNEIFDNIPCDGTCDALTAVNVGTPITIVAGQSVRDVNFALEWNPAYFGSISGAVRTPSGRPVVGRQVVITPTFLELFWFVTVMTDDDGRYAANALPPGDYRAYTAGDGPDQLYRNIPCAESCNTSVETGTPIEVVAGATTHDIDFVLAAGTIRVVVTNVRTTPRQAVANREVVVVSSNASTFGPGLVATTDAFGESSLGDIPPGRYYAFTRGSFPNLVNQAYSQRPCTGECSIDLVKASTTFSVPTGGRVGISFALEPAASITGKVMSGALPIPGNVVVYPTAVGTPPLPGTFPIAPDGTFTAYGLRAPSSYYVATSVDRYGNEFYNNIPCPGICDPTVATGATTVTVSQAGETVDGIDFDLILTGAIAGTVRDARSLAPLADTPVLIFTRVGNAVLPAASAMTDASGGYNVWLPTGTYFAMTDRASYANRVFDSQGCALRCSGAEAVYNGSAIVVGERATTTVNFVLEPLAVSSWWPAAPDGLTATVIGGDARLTWNAPSTAFGGAATGYIVEIGHARGATELTVPATTTSLAIASTPAGRYFARVRGINANGTGPASQEIELTVGANGDGVPSPPPGLSASVIGRVFSATWGESRAGGPVWGYLLEVGSATGLANLATVPVANAFITYEPVPDGVYFLRVRAANATGLSLPSNELMLVVGNKAAPPAAPDNFSAAANASRTVTLGWTAPAGLVESYTLEAGNAPGLSDVAVINTRNPETMLTIPDVPVGTYYLRLRARNSSGTSVVSSEVVLIVR